MSSVYGEHIKLSIFGQSHSAAIGMSLDCIPAGQPVDEAALAAMKENAVVWVPTISTVGNLRGKGRFEEAAVTRIFESAAENVRAFAAMGGLLGCGSDAGAWAVPHGCGAEERFLGEILGEDAAQILQKGNQAIVEKF